MTMKRSKGRCRRRHAHLANAKKGRKNGRKRKRKNGSTTNLQQQEQQQSYFQQQSHQQQQPNQQQPNQQQQQPTRVLRQSNLDGIIVKSLDVEGFGDAFHPI